MSGEKGMTEDEMSCSTLQLLKPIRVLSLPGHALVSNEATFHHHIGFKFITHPKWQCARKPNRSDMLLVQTYLMSKLLVIIAEKELLCKFHYNKKIVKVDVDIHPGMVGYNETKSKAQLSEFWQGFAGVLSGMITRLLCQPLDVLKIRFQLQHEPLLKSHENYYWSLKQASVRILKEESFAALWKGHVPAQLLSGAYGLAQFGSFELMTKIVFNVYHGENNKTVTHSICGGLSGGLATAITMPFDTIRTRLVGQGEPKIYRGISHACLCMVREEGVTSLYKGLAPNLIQIVPHTGMQFGFFQLFSNLYRYLRGTTDSEKLPMYANLMAGSGAGLLAKAGVYPMDLAKKRLQVQGFETARSKFGKVKKYNGLRHCIALTWKEEGASGLYKGFLPSTVKAMLTTGLIFSLYEEITQIFLSLNE